MVLAIKKIFEIGSPFLGQNSLSNTNSPVEHRFTITERKMRGQTYHRMSEYILRSMNLCL
ncbi:hypothetical protein AVM02_07015 [Brucella anthropi]